MHLPSLLQFLSGLAENNNRPWFAHNKPQYDILREEFIALTAEVGNRVRKFDKSLPPFEAKKAVFRIYRDVRFAKDKSPYKTNIGAVIGPRNKSDDMHAMRYFHVDHQGRLLVASGFYMPPPPVLKRVREHIVANPKALDKVLKDATFKKVFGGLSEEHKLSRPPKGFAADHPQIELIKLKSFFCETQTDLTKKSPKDLAGFIATQFEAAEPLLKWLGAMSDTPKKAKK
jgi:uncharacterized protein (TIGR02453 family)